MPARETAAASASSCRRFAASTASSPVEMVARTSVLMLAMAGAMLRAEQCASFVIPSTGFTGLLRASRPASGQNSGRGSSLLGVIMKYEIDYKLDKKRDVEGGSVYDVTVNVDPKLVKDSYGALCACQHH